MVYRKFSFKKCSCSLSQKSSTEVIYVLFSTTVLVFGICHYLLEHLSEVMYQGTTVFWCIKNLQMEPAVAFISEPRPILRLANDASCTAFFFLLLLALSDSSVCALLLLRGTIMSYKAFPKPHFYIVHIKPINVRPV